MEQYLEQHECETIYEVATLLGLLKSLLEEPEILPATKAISGELFENISDQHTLARITERRISELTEIFSSYGCYIEEIEGLKGMFGEPEVLSKKDL